MWDSVSNWDRRREVPKFTFLSRLQAFVPKSIFSIFTEVVRFLTDSPNSSFTSAFFFETEDYLKAAEEMEFPNSITSLQISYITIHNWGVNPPANSCFNPAITREKWGSQREVRKEWKSRKWVSMGLRIISSPTSCFTNGSERFSSGVNYIT